MGGSNISGLLPKKFKNNYLSKIFHPKIKLIKDSIKTWEDVARDPLKKIEYLFSAGIKKYVKYGSKMKGYKRFMFCCASLGRIKHTIVILKQNNLRVYFKSSFRIKEYLTTLYNRASEFRYLQYLWF